jgi:hypothetical protein
VTWFVEFVKTIGGPGSLGFLALFVGVALALRWWRRGWFITRLTAVLASVVVAGYLLLAWPPVARAVVGALPAVAPPSPQELAAIDTLVILDGDNFAGRVRSSMDVLATSTPRALWLLGQRYLLDDLELAGFPVERLTRDGSAQNTSMQLEQVRAIGRQAARRPAVIASRVHAPRLVRLAKALDVDLLLVPAQLDREPPTSGFWAYVPQYGSLMASRDAIYEIVALRYYQWRGTIPPDGP